MKKPIKRLHFLLSLLLCCSLVFCFAFAGCDAAEQPEEPGHEQGQLPGGPSEPEKPDDPQKPSEPEKPDDSQKPNEPQTPDEPEKTFSVVYRAGYAPKKFSGVTNEIVELGEGVHLVANKLQKTNGQDVVVYTIEVDLQKANIVAGSKENRTSDTDYRHATPYSMAQAWERSTGGHVYSSLNADFFNQNLADGKTVNAFVKDGIILKDGHNNNGNYDYKVSAADVPASAPMLFGVKGTTAQIAPILQYEGDVTSAAVKETLVTAKLGYAIGHEGDYIELKENAEPSSGYISLRTSGSSSQTRGIAVKVDTSDPIALKVLETVEVTSSRQFEASEGCAWLQSGARFSSDAGLKYLRSLQAGDTVKLSVASPDGTWNGYETILGCRQALVLDDEIAATVTKENSNGAQSSDVPRSAVGLKPDGTVVIFAVESMYYGKKNKSGDPHGMDLPELAEFAYFYGCNVAANFDGGGSTQLVVRGEKDETGRVVIRSSDTASTALFETRIVANAILVTSRNKG